MKIGWTDGRAGERMDLETEQEKEKWEGVAGDSPFSPPLHFFLHNWHMSTRSLHFLSTNNNESQNLSEPLARTHGRTSMEASEGVCERLCVWTSVHLSYVEPPTICLLSCWIVCVCFVFLRLKGWSSMPFAMPWSGCVKLALDFLALFNFEGKWGWKNCW